MRFNHFLRCLCCDKRKTFNLNWENDDNSSKEKGSRIFQYAATFNTSLSSIGVGELLGWTSPALIFLSSKKSNIPINAEQGAWLASINSLGTIIGFLTVSLLMDRLSRKKAMIIYAIPQIISWTMVIFGKNFTILCLSRIIGGCGYAASVTLSTVYIAEISEKEIRGMLAVFLELSVGIGTLIVALTGQYLSYQNMNLILLIPSILYFITLPFIPESPYFYFMKNRQEEGLKALLKLRGKKNPESIRREVEEIKNFAQFEGSNKCNFLELFTSKSNRKALFIVSLAMLTNVLSGSVVLLTYTQEIFEYSGFSLSPANSTALLIGVQTISGLVATQLVKKIDRRVSFLFSGISAGISLFFVGIFFFLKYQIQMDISGITWMPLAGLLAYEIACPLGIMTVPQIFIGEFFSMKVKKSAVGTVFLISSCMAFLTKLVFPLLNDAVGIYTIFWMFAFLCLLGTLLVFYNAPETKGKSLDEIQSILNST